MIDYQEDRDSWGAWKERDSGIMSLDDLIELALRGHEQCEEYCPSRDSKKYGCGEGGCFCIRAYFPSPTHYEAYLMLRGLVKELEALKLLGMLITKKEAQANYGENE